MPSDNKSKMSRKEFITSKKRAEPSKKKKINDDSSDDSSYHPDDTEDEEMDEIEYRKFLKQIFPSKHLDKKIKAGEKLKQALEDDFEDADSESDEDTKLKQLKHSASKKNLKRIRPTKFEDNDNSENDSDYKSPKKITKRKKQIIESETEDEDEDDDEYDSEDQDSNHEYEEENDTNSPKPNKFNIIFTIGAKRNKNNEYEDDEDDNEEDWETCSKTDTNTENEDDPISSDEESQSDEEKPTKKHKASKKKDTTEDNSEILDKLKDALDLKTDDLNNSEDETLIKTLKELQSKNKNNVLINNCLQVCEQTLQLNKQKQNKKMKKEKDRNSRIFKRILRDKNTMNDFEFYEKMETGQQKKIIKELREINKITRIEKPYRLTLLESNIPVIFKAAAMKKISSLRYMEPGSGEFYKIKNWVDTFMRIPFGQYKTLPLTITDGIDKCHDFMANAQKTLDDAVYGLNDAKMQIMQMLGQLITNPNAIGSALAIHGPMGTGKTSIVKDGISKILNRPFAFIALGGATDSSFLEGHGYTYEGSTWGKIVQILIDCKCMNPIIYFDELDKISDTPKGEEITGILTHLTDTSQNSQFHDKYFAEIDFDLSKCLFIFSYNDESKVNPILRDRMYRIQTKGYSPKQKTTISNNYLLPKIREQVKFEAEDIIIPDQTLSYIIENYCNKEDGVRNLKRCLEIIYTKLNLYRLMRPGSNLFENEMSLKVEFPFNVTKDIVDKLIKKTDDLNPSLYHLYV